VGGHRSLIVAVAVCLGGFAAVASAQVTPARRPAPPRRPRKPRTHFIRVTASAGLEVAGQTIDQTFTHLRNAESATTHASVELGRVPFYELGADIRVRPRWAIGASGSFQQHRSNGDAIASIPHPFFFNMPRTVQGTFSDIDGHAIGAHVQVRWFRPVGRKLELSIIGGPSFFHVQQEFVTDVVDGSTYPYDTAVFAGVTTATQTKAAVGFNAGSDLTLKLSKHAGIGAAARYAAATASFSVVGQTVDVRAGGVQVAGGLRITF
jgi:hypothetical protein